MSAYASPEVQTTHVDRVVVNDKYTIECNHVVMGEPGLANIYFEFTVEGPGLELIDLGAGSPGYLAHACLNDGDKTAVFGWASGNYDLERPVKWYDGNKSVRVSVPKLTFTLDSAAVYTNSNDDLLVDANEASPIDWTYGTAFETMESAITLAAWLHSTDMV